jgi:hypothetical protein
MTSSKHFKVFRTSHPYPDGWQHRLIAVDGECWNIDRECDQFAPAWFDGQIIEVTTKHISTGDPSREIEGFDWDCFGCVSAEQCNPLSTHAMVLQAWGMDAATRYAQLGVRRTGIDIKVHAPVSYFTPTKSTSAESKAEIAARIFYFFANDFRPDLLNPILCRNIALIFGIESTEPDAFYSRWFSTTPKKLAFLRRVMQDWSTGDPATTLGDVKNFLLVRIVERILGRWSNTDRRARAVAERAQLVRLLKQHGVPRPFRLFCD